jgi:hypothetical protein
MGLDRQLHVVVSVILLPHNPWGRNYTIFEVAQWVAHLKESAVAGIFIVLNHPN